MLAAILFIFSVIDLNPGDCFMQRPYAYKRCKKLVQKRNIGQILIYLPYSFEAQMYEEV